MKTIDIITPEHVSYQPVCEFANTVYQDTLRATTRTPPEILFAALENNNVFGCVGLSASVSSSMFLNDERYKKALQGYPSDIHIGEQNILAVRQFPAGIPLLIASGSAYAHQLGIQKIAFAGIEVSCKAIKRLGFDLTVVGEVLPSTFSVEERIKYALWLERHRPISCILDTTKAPIICKKIMERFSKKARLAFEITP